ncbi:hypothetical protein SUDANB146_06501 (plasmid) [Streptomyces sp. enrichment culture]
MIGVFSLRGELRQPRPGHAAGLAAWGPIVADEAHRVSGRIRKPWAVVHDSQKVPSLRRGLCMTATPRLWQRKKDAEGPFGSRAFTLTLSEAIDREGLRSLAAGVRRVSRPIGSGSRGGAERCGSSPLRERAFAARRRTGVSRGICVRRWSPQPGYLCASMEPARSGTRRLGHCQARKATVSRPGAGGPAGPVAAPAGSPSAARPAHGRCGCGPSHRVPGRGRRGAAVAAVGRRCFACPRCRGGRRKRWPVVCCGPTRPAASCVPGAGDGAAPPSPCGGRHGRCRGVWFLPARPSGPWWPGAAERRGRGWVRALCRGGIAGASAAAERSSRSSRSSRSFVGSSQSSGSGPLSARTPAEAGGEHSPCKRVPGGRG